jgi:UDP-3-O-[3-hydroxymyristoyl] glucosamine N-acyltransferase
MFPEPISLRRIAEWLEADLEGDASGAVSSLAVLDEAGPDALTFAADARNEARLAASRAAAAIASRTAPAAPDGPVLLRVDDVPLALARLLGRLAEPEDLPPAGVAPSAVVAPNAAIAPTAAIGPHVTVAAGASVGAGTAVCAGAVLARGVTVGEHCMLAEGVVVRQGCRIGNRVRIGPNSVIGYDGFGYHLADGVHHKIPHIGNVEIEDDVELGASVCVDRAKWGATRIGAGSKIDNLVQIAHNVQVGPGCILVSQVGVAGSARLGRFVVLGGHVGIRDNITLGDRTTVGACSCVAQSTGDGETLFGIPAKDARTRLRENQALAKLPELLQRVARLEKMKNKEGEP